MIPMETYTNSNNRSTPNNERDSVVTVINTTSSIYLTTDAEIHQLPLELQLVVGVSTSLLIVLLVVLIMITNLVLIKFWKYKKNSTNLQLEQHDDGSTNWSQSYTISDNVYEQPQISTSVVQMNSDHTAEDEHASNNYAMPQQTQIDIHSTTEAVLHSHSQVKEVNIEPNQKPTSAEVTFTYAVVDKSKNKKCVEMRNDEHINHEINSPPVSAYIPEEGSTEINKTEEAIEEMYAVVNKRRKSQVSEEEEAPSIPPHTVEELYAAVNKTPNDSAEEKAPPIPPHTLESLYTAVKKTPITDHQKDKDCKP